MTRSMRIGPICVLAACALCLVVQVGHAHPLGNYSINQYLMLDLRGERLEIYYLLDLAEIPSFSELDLVKRMWRFAYKTDDIIGNRYFTAAIAPWGPAVGLKDL